MSDFRDYLKDYAETINNLLQTHDDDQALITAAEQTWELKDPRRLVFTAPSGIRFPTPPPKSSGGDVQFSNELPPQITPPATKK